LGPTAIAGGFVAAVENTASFLRGNLQEKSTLADWGTLGAGTVKTDTPSMTAALA